MKWTTRSHLHLDRTASAWLIQAFVDPGAEFEFLAWGDAPDSTDARSFGMPGLLLSSHDEQGTCFAKILEHHELRQDASLVALERGIAAGVRAALGIPAPADQTAAEAGLGSTLDIIGTGLGLLYPDDHRHLEAAIPLYDALYQALRATHLDLDDAPAARPEQLAYIRERLGITSGTS